MIPWWYLLVFAAGEGVGIALVFFYMSWRTYQEVKRWRE